MSSRPTKCPYCRRRYVHAGPYEKHLQTAHPEINMSLAASAARSTCEPTMYEDRNVGNDTGRENRHINSDCESEVSEIPQEVPERTAVAQIFPGAGLALGDVVDYVEINTSLAKDPWGPFASEDEFKLASWFIRSKVSKTRINDYFAQGIGDAKCGTFQSAYTLEKYLNELDPFGQYLAWTQVTVECEKRPSTFFYRNIVDCVRYVLRQVAYKDDMVYAPVHEDDSDRNRMYSEMHTVDWRWNFQVQKLTTQFQGAILILTRRRTSFQKAQLLSQLLECQTKPTC